ncbi:hypothetical protein D3C81_1049900 [compost metagenome]
MLVDLVAGHQIGDRVRPLDQAVLAAIGNGEVVVDAALPGDVATDAQLLKRALEAVGGGQLEQVLGGIGVEALVDVAGVGGVFERVDAGIGVAGTDLPVAGQRTLQLHVDTLAAYLARGDVAVGRVAAAGQVGLRNATVFLVDTEQRQAGIEGAIEVLALDADFIVLALDRLERAAGSVLVLLRVEDVAVADIHRVMIVQVVDQARVASDVARDFVIGAGTFLVVIVIPVQAAAQDQLQRIGQAQAGGHVHAFLGSDFAYVVGVHEVRLAGIDRPVGVVWAVVACVHVVDALAGAHHQLVGAA